MIETYDSDEIDSMSFEQFSSPLLNDKYGKEFVKTYFDENNYVNSWFSLLNKLDRKNK